MRICLLILLFLSLGCKATVELGSLGPVVLDEPMVVTPDESSVPYNDSAGSVAPVEEPEQAATPVEEPKEPVKAPVMRKRIIQYTIESCKWCKHDVDRVIPRWVRAGWNFDPKTDIKDETKEPKPGGYPRYEIYDAQGKVTVHHGSLISLKP